MKIATPLYRALFLLCLLVPFARPLSAQGIEQTPAARSAFAATPAASTGSLPSDGVSAPTVKGEAMLRIGPGDLLQVKVFDSPELSQDVRVDDLGNATFTFIGKLHVADMTTEQIQDVMVRKLTEGNFLLHPQVSVLIQEYGTQGVSILGEVQKPGIYPVLGNRTLLDVISAAGGTTPYAGSTVTVKRSADGTMLTVPLTKNAQASLASDIKLEPGDKVLIPRASLVYVIGDVGRPGGFVMQNDGHITVLQAMALAGGQTRTASLSHARLIRKTATDYSEVPVSLKKIMDGKQRDVELQGEDILYVPNSTMKSVMYHGVPSILQSASNAAVYAAVP